MTLTGIHGYVAGFTLIGGWFLIAVWAGILRLARRDEAPVFWRVVSAAQVLLVLQLVLGVILLLLGRRPGGGGAYNTIFHLLYGFGFPLIVLFMAHKWSRSGRYDAFTLFAVAGLVIAALNMRGWMVGLFGT